MRGTALTTRPVAVVDGCRTPFLRSGTDYVDLTAYDLGRMTVSALLHRSRIDPEAVDALVMGTVIADARTSNLGREVALGAGLPRSCPAWTVSIACISSLMAFVDAVRAIETGAAEVAVVAGAETLSDVPIKLSRPVRKRLIAAQKARGPGDYLALLKGLTTADLKPERMAIAEFSTGEVMGENAERLTKRLGISRAAQDEFALASHHRAAAAAADGRMARQIESVTVAGKRVSEDNGVRADSTLEKLASLKPAFDRRFGTVTAGNSSFLTDGGAALLVMSVDAAERLGYEPLALVRASSISAQDPLEELLVGPALTLPRVLEAAALELDEVEVVELHEAFAGQVLAVLALMEDPEFCRERLGRARPVGTVDRARLNAWGGSLSVGHPFGATGARLVLNCCHRLEHEAARWGAIAACAAGGLGIGLLLERP